MIAKNLTKEVVKNYAQALMLQNDTTTTLDVKEVLRERGYYATQEEISEIMKTLCEEESWCFTSNGKYKIYWLNS